MKNIELSFNMKYEIYTKAYERAKVYNLILSICLLAMLIFPIILMEIKWWVRIISFVGGYFLLNILIITPLERIILKCLFKKIRQTHIDKS